MRKRYPHIPLNKAIDRCKLIFDADQTNVIDREAAALHLGYSSRSGASEGMLGVLSLYGLLETAGTGQTKITNLGLDIFAPESVEGKKRALFQAGHLPEVFAAIRDHFDTVPSEMNLRNWLVRGQYPKRSIQAIMKSYYQTLEFLKQEGVMDGTSPSGNYNANLNSESETEDDLGIIQIKPEQIIPAPNHPTPSEYMGLSSSKRNDFTIVADGLVLQINCKNVDVEGVSRLRRELEMYEGILKIRQAAYDEENEEWSED